MNKFVPILQELNRKLDLPPATKARVILEIADDLQASYEYYLRSSPEQEAYRKAVEKFRLDDTALAELRRLHTKGINRWFDKLSHFRFEWWGRIALLVSLVYLVCLTFNRINIIELVGRANGFIWVALLIAVLAGVLVLERIFQLYLIKNYAAKTLRTGLGSLLGLAIGSVICGILGSAVEFYRMSNRLFFEEAEFLPVFVASLDHAVALGVFTLLLAIIIAMIWYVLLQKAVTIEQDEVTQLLELDNE